MSKLLEDATYEELILVLQEKRNAEHQPRIDQILRLEASAKETKSALAAIRARLVELRYPLNECPNRHRHTLEATNDFCLLCDGHEYLR